MEKLKICIAGLGNVGSELILHKEMNNSFMESNAFIT